LQIQLNADLVFFVIIMMILPNLLHRCAEPRKQKLVLMSVVQFVKYRTELITDRRKQMKKDILTYNFDDVMTTKKFVEGCGGYLTIRNKLYWLLISGQQLNHLFVMLLIF
jgi:hypothetical protein